ncbi:hypothetical protein E2C01_057234 [Portunus trituberculatus]|uniref:Uncharacterized protein n=1 Tax=Portunus trituberculatus TaxID=210409 RepID=A0A5B7GSV9_PORTR|nr:hypothetical protein [Portunus trituberculatus]
MLKVPENDQTKIVPAPAPHHPLHRPEDEMLDSQNDDSSQHTNPFSFSPHSFFDGIFQQFGMHPSKTPFPGKSALQQYSVLCPTLCMPKSAYAIALTCHIIVFPFKASVPPNLIVILDIHTLLSSFELAWVN